MHNLFQLFSSFITSIPDIIIVFPEMYSSNECFDFLLQTSLNSVFVFVYINLPNGCDWETTHNESKSKYSSTYKWNYVFLFQRKYGKLTPRKLEDWTTKQLTECVRAVNRLLNKCQLTSWYDEINFLFLEFLLSTTHHNNTHTLFIVHHLRFWIILLAKKKKKHKKCQTSKREN